jgi:hypothetical protein
MEEMPESSFPLARISSVHGVKTLESGADLRQLLDSEHLFGSTSSAARNRRKPVCCSNSVSKTPISNGHSASDKPAVSPSAAKNCVL